MYYSPYGLGYGYGLDPTYLLVIIGAVISLWASFKVKSTFNKYSRIRSTSGMTGAQAAAEILRYNGIGGVRIEHVSGELTDHFDPRTRVVRLSDSTYNSTSVAAIGVAAHEIGHVIQHERGYVPIKIRGALVPVANIGSSLGLPLVMIGFILGMFDSLVQIGILLFSFAVFFQVITLPVEFDASHRALVALTEQGILSKDEVKYSRKVLSAAAMTYVAAAAASIMQLLRLMLLANNGKRRR